MTSEEIEPVRKILHETRRSNYNVRAKAKTKNLMDESRKLIPPNCCDHIMKWKYLRPKEDSPNKRNERVYLSLQKWAGNVPKKETGAIYGWNVLKDAEFKNFNRAFCRESII